MKRHAAALDEDGEPIPCGVCAGTGIAPSGPVEGSCWACCGTGSEQSGVDPDDARDEDFEREQRDEARAHRCES